MTVSATTDSNYHQNAFHRAFLDRLATREEPLLCVEADYQGAWMASASRGSFVVHRPWESPEENPPRARFVDLALAKLAAAALPTCGASLRLRLDAADSGAGYALLWSCGQGPPVGALRHFEESVAEALSTLLALASNPEGLAHLLQAAGGSTLEQTGRILAQSFATGDG